MTFPYCPVLQLFLDGDLSFFQIARFALFKRIGKDAMPVVLLFFSPKNSKETQAPKTRLKSPTLDVLRHKNCCKRGFWSGATSACSKSTAPFHQRATMDTFLHW